MNTTLDTAQAQGVLDFHDGIPCRVLMYDNQEQRIAYIIGYFSARWGMNDNGLITPPPRMYEWDDLQDTIGYEEDMLDREFWSRGSW